MKRISLHQRPGTHHGFSMLEVLITLFILSVGLLGLAAMQAEGLKTSSGSLLRSKAVVAMADITDRMRANVAGFNNYSLTLGGTISSPPDCAAIQCSATQMAQFDMAQWLQTLQAAGSGLPGAQAAIIALPAVPPAVGPGRFAFTVSWTDRQERNEAVATDEQYSTEVQF